MLINILFSFLLNFLILIVLNNILNVKNNIYIKIITIYCLMISILSCIFIFINILIFPNIIFILDLGNWIEFDNLRVKWEFIFDSMNILMVLTVIIISSLVHIYSFDYMKLDPHFSRFISYLSLFTFFMLILLTANNLIVMFIGWEGVGLCSYLLINFWYTRIQANKAAIKAIIINKIGDFGILFSYLLIFNIYETFDYHTLFLLITKNEYINYICFFLFLGCMAKSAQIGLHMWLPDAMEGPTPVSALIHAATMVTAGVFLVIKCSFIFELSFTILIFITIIGLFTAIFGATVGLFQFDIKKIIAYSTCSQLGLMFCACGLSAYSLSLFHLINHAFFKALLFLCAGSIIHALNDEQDIRKMGGLAYKLPLTYQSMFIASLSLMGFPFLSGYYSKELILLVVLFDNFDLNYDFFGFGIVFITSIITVAYSLKILFQVFFFKYNGYKIKYFNIHEVSEIVIFVYIVLIIFSILSGYLFKDLIIGIGSMFLNNSIYFLPLNYNIQYLEFISSIIKLIILCIPLFGYYLYCYYYLDFIYFSRRNLDYLLFLYIFNKKYFFDRIFNEISLIIIRMSFNYVYIYLDKGLIENTIHLILRKIYRLSKNINTYNNFNLFTYLFIIYIMFVSIFLFFLSILYYKKKIIYFFLFLIVYKIFNMGITLFLRAWAWLMHDQEPQYRIVIIEEVEENVF